MQLARLQGELQESGFSGIVRTAAVTYDPGFDLPPRMRAYGENRVLLFGQHNRMLRTVEGLPTLENYFQLGVNFVGSIVNRHQIELNILDAAGLVQHSLTRLQWDTRDVRPKKQASPPPTEPDPPG